MRQNQLLRAWAPRLFSLIWHIKEIQTTVRTWNLIFVRVLKLRFFKSAKKGSCASRYSNIRIDPEWIYTLYVYTYKSAPHISVRSNRDRCDFHKQAGPSLIHSRGKKMGIEVFDCVHDYLRIERCKKSYLGKPGTRVRRPKRHVAHLQ